MKKNFKSFCFITEPVTGTNSRHLLSGIDKIIRLLDLLKVDVKLDDPDIDNISSKADSIKSNTDTIKSDLSTVKSNTTTTKNDIASIKTDVHAILELLQQHYNTAE